jgi:hypothetical protein
LLRQSAASARLAKFQAYRANGSMGFVMKIVAREGDITLLSVQPAMGCRLLVIVDEPFQKIEEMVVLKYRHFADCRWATIFGKRGYLRSPNAYLTLA